MTRLIELLADSLVVNRSTHRVVDLTRLARQLGAADVVYRPQRVHGYTEWTVRGPRIVLAMAPSDARRRSTLAHECGHLALDPVLRPEALTDAPESQRTKTNSALPLGLDPDLVRSLGRHLPLERICDLLAYELLLPQRLVREVTTAPWTLPGLTAFCDALRVSMSVSVIQVNTVAAERGQEQVGVLQLRSVGEEYWMASTTSGMPEGWRDRVLVTTKCDPHLRALGPGVAHRSTIELTNGITTRPVRTEMMRHARGITMLVHTRDLR